MLDCKWAESSNSPSPPPKRRICSVWDGTAPTMRFIVGRSNQSGSGGALVAAGMTAVHFREQPPRELLRFQFPGASPLVSPDGRKVAYSLRAGSASRAMHVRSLDSLESVAVKGTEDYAGSAFWTPDSRYIYFCTGES